MIDLTLDYLFGILKISNRSGLEALEGSTFKKVPIEIIAQIASYLSPASAAAFSICCQPIASMLGPRYLSNLGQGWSRTEGLSPADGLATIGNLNLTTNSSSSEIPSPSTSQSALFEFLSILGREFLKKIACYQCKDFHATDEVRGHVPSNWNRSLEPPCWKDLESHGHKYFLNHKFRIPYFQKTMRDYRSGRDVSKALERLSVRTTTIYSEPYTLQHKSTAQICNGSLVLRTQTVFLVPWSRLRHGFPNEPVLICPHIRKVSWPSVLGRCAQCHTEFLVDFENFLEHGVAKFITKWQDLGNGLSEQWRNHLVDPEGPTDRSVEYATAIGSIVEAFEGNPGIFKICIQRVLTPRDRMKLLARNPDAGEYVAANCQLVGPYPRQ